VTLGVGGCVYEFLTEGEVQFFGQPFADHRTATGGAGEHPAFDQRTQEQVVFRRFLRGVYGHERSPYRFRRAGEHGLTRDAHNGVADFG